MIFLSLGTIKSTLFCLWGKAHKRSKKTFDFELPAH
jgi:hypothetical protein